MEISMNRRLLQLPLALAAFGIAAHAAPPAKDDKPDPKLTEQWEPVPPVVTPGATDSAPPSDAMVLFD
jgi:hypothetical protein